MPLLGVNIDHVATIRQARRESDPDPVKAALICQKAGADSIVAGTLILEGDNSYTGATTISAGTLQVGNSNALGTGAVTNNATLDVGTASLSGISNYTQNTAATLKITANSATDFGTLTAATVSNASSKVIITVGGYIPNSTTFNNVINGTGVSVPGTITSSSPIFTIAGSLSGSNVSLTAARANSYNSFATNANSNAAGKVLNSIADSGIASGDITNILGALDSLGSGGQIDQALGALAPNVDNGSPQVSYETQAMFVNTAIDHINTVFQGAAASPGALDPAVWAQTFGTYLHQDPRGASNGYNATVWGILGGYEKQLRSDFALGVSTGYARDEIRTKDSGARTGVDSYQLGLYGSFTRSAYYLDGLFSFAYNNYDASRHINFGGIDRIPASDYGGQQYSAYFEGGRNFNLKKFMITPLASIQYMRLNIDGYTEKNAGAANLKVDSQGSNLLQSGLGAKIAYPIETKNFSIIPDFHFKWLYSFINDNQQASSTFTGGGASFTTGGFNSPTSSFNLGTKWAILTRNNTSVYFNYDYEVKPDFYGHSGYVNVRHEF